MIIKVVAVALIALCTLSSYGVALAANTPTISQTINAGVLSTDILNASRVAVASPSVAFTSKTYSFDCQSGVNASTGTLGSTSEREYVMNPNAANNGWTLTMAATSGPTAVWTSGGNSFDFNDATSSGCTDGGDTDSRGGQLTVNPSVATLTADCVSCTITNVAKGSNASFVEGTTNSVTLLNAAAASDDLWRGYIYGSAMAQTIPLEQAAGAYTLGMTLTVTAS